MNAEGGQSLYRPPPEDAELSTWQWQLKPGDRVRVLGDDGNEFVAVVKSKPWQLGHGEWVIGLQGIAGGYLLRRVQVVIESHGVEWWQGVAEAKQEEIQRLTAALEMLAQVRHICGNAQNHMRMQLRTIDAVLAGADVRDLTTYEAVIAGTWKPINK